MSDTPPVVRKSVPRGTAGGLLLTTTARRVAVAARTNVRSWRELARNQGINLPEWRSWTTFAGLLLGLAAVASSTAVQPLRLLGWQALGPIVGIALVVCSLFGDLPAWIAWTQRLGAWLYPGIVVGTLALLIPLLLPTGHRDTSLIAFSPSVWAAYLSIVLVGISFEASSLPRRLYHACQTLRVGPAVVVPTYVIVAGLLGNILDGVSIMAISVVIFLSLLPLRWAVRSSFALLFGGLIANLITVAAEPTNIKFQDILHGLLDRVSPPFWFTNWPISVLGILVPAGGLALLMRREHITWRQDEPDANEVFVEKYAHGGVEVVLAMWALLLLAAGIILHSTLQAASLSTGAIAAVADRFPLWLLLLPAGVMAVVHLAFIRNVRAARRHIQHEWPVWGKLMVIFSLLWFLANALTGPTNALATFFTWPEPVRYSSMVVLSLASSITDNVALAAMQGAILINHALAIWQIRLLFILLTWSGGFTPFGCLQSLAVNSRINLSTARWFRETLVWSGLSIAGGLAGLALIALLYPGAVGLLH